jgi:hypothetical protein
MQGATTQHGSIICSDPGAKTSEALSRVRAFCGILLVKLWKRFKGGTRLSYAPNSPVELMSHRYLPKLSHAFADNIFML